MNMTTLKSFLCAALVVSGTLFGAHAVSATADGQDRTLSAATCGTFLRDFAAKSIQKTEDHVWLAGYLSVYNYLKSITLQILGNSNLLSAELWVKSYCEQNPLKDIGDAAEALMVQLYPTRTLKAQN